MPHSANPHMWLLVVILLYLPLLNASPNKGEMIVELINRGHMLMSVISLTEEELRDLYYQTTTAYGITQETTEIFTDSTTQVASTDTSTSPISTINDLTESTTANVTVTEDQSTEISTDGTTARPTPGGNNKTKPTSSTKTTSSKMGSSTFGETTTDNVTTMTETKSTKPSTTPKGHDGDKKKPPTKDTKRTPGKSTSTSDLRTTTEEKGTETSTSPLSTTSSEFSGFTEETPWTSTSSSTKNIPPEETNTTSVKGSSPSHSKSTSATKPAAGAETPNGQEKPTATPDDKGTTTDETTGSSTVGYKTTGKEEDGSTSVSPDVSDATTTDFATSTINTDNETNSTSTTVSPGVPTSNDTTKPTPKPQPTPGNGGEKPDDGSGGSFPTVSIPPVNPGNASVPGGNGGYTLPISGENMTESGHSNPTSGGEERKTTDRNGTPGDDKGTGESESGGDHSTAGGSSPSDNDGTDPEWASTKAPGKNDSQPAEKTTQPNIEISSGTETSRETEITHETPESPLGDTTKGGVTPNSGLDDVESTVAPGETSDSSPGQSEESQTTTKPNNGNGITKSSGGQTSGGSGKDGQDGSGSEGKETSGSHEEGGSGGDGPETSGPDGQGGNGGDGAETTVATVQSTTTRMANGTEVRSETSMDYDSTPGMTKIPDDVEPVGSKNNTSGATTEAPTGNVTTTTTPSVQATTTRVMADGTKVLSESTMAFDNCTMLIEQVRQYPNGTVDNWSQWFETGCTPGMPKIPGDVEPIGSENNATGTLTTAIPGNATSVLTGNITTTTNHPVQPTTTRIMADGTKVLSETATAFDNCTMLIEQVRQYRNGSTENWSQWFDTGCTPGMPKIPGDLEQVQPQMNSTIPTSQVSSKDTTTTTHTPTTRVLPDGTKILDEIANYYPNCTLNIIQLKRYPNGSEETTSEWIDTGCTTSTPHTSRPTTAPGAGGQTQATQPSQNSSNPDVPVLPGEDGSPETVTVEDQAPAVNLTTTTTQKAVNNNTTKTSVASRTTATVPTVKPGECSTLGFKNDSTNNIYVNGTMMVQSCITGYLFPDGTPLKTFECVNGKWAGYTNLTCQADACPALKIEFANSGIKVNSKTTRNDGKYDIGTMIVHTCKARYAFPSGEPLRIYECLKTGKWTGNLNSQPCQSVEL